MKIHKVSVGRKLGFCRVFYPFNNAYNQNPPSLILYVLVGGVNKFYGRGGGNGWKGAIVCRGGLMKNGWKAKTGLEITLGEMV